MKGPMIPKIELNTVHLYQHYSLFMHNKLQYTWRGDYCECVRPAQLPVLAWSSNSVLPGTTSTIRSHRDRAGYNRQAMVQASELSFPVVFNTELRSSLWEFHSFRSLPADTTMVFQGTQPSKMNKREATIAWYIPFQVPFLTPYFTIFLIFFSDNILLDVASKQQTRDLFLSSMVTRTRTYRTDQKTDKPDGKPVLCQRTLSSVFRVVLYS